LFEETGHLEELVTFPSGSLRYALERSPASEKITADFVNGSLTILVPVAAARHWTTSADVGMDICYQRLDILIEKDFQCAHGPVDQDAFPPGENENPNGR